MTQYNPDGRYEVFVIGAIANGPQAGFIYNSAWKTDDLFEAQNAFTSERESSPYGAQIFDHQEAENIAEHITPQRRALEQRLGISA